MVRLSLCERPSYGRLSPLKKRNRYFDPKRTITIICKGGRRVNRKDKSFQGRAKLRESLCQQGKKHWGSTWVPDDPTHTQYHLKRFYWWRRNKLDQKKIRRSIMHVSHNLLSEKEWRLIVIGFFKITFRRGARKRPNGHKSTYSRLECQEDIDWSRQLNWYTISRCLQRYQHGYVRVITLQGHRSRFLQEISSSIGRPTYHDHLWMWKQCKRHQDKVHDSECIISLQHHDRKADVQCSGIILSILYLTMKYPLKGGHVGTNQRWSRII